MPGLAVGLVFFLVYYGIGVMRERLIVSCFRCKSCRAPVILDLIYLSANGKRFAL